MQTRRDRPFDGSPVLSTTAVIPALDEERSIGAVLDAIPKHLVDEIIVVDGGSRDNTAAVAAAHGATIVREPRRGYGRACTAGADRARGEVVVFLDADGAADPREIARLLAPIASGGADLVLGSRLTGEVAPGAMPWHQRVGNRLCAFLIRSLYGQPLTDLGPFRAVRRVRLKQMTLCDLTYGWPTEMIVKAVHAGWRIAEVPVTCHVRTGGRSKISGTLRGTTLATFHILRTIVRHARPMRVQRATGGSVVAIMAKQPAAGRTKTRLCPPLSPSAAAELYEALLNDTIMLVSSVPDVRLAVADTPGDGAWRPAVPGGALLLAMWRDASAAAQVGRGQIIARKPA